MEIWSNTPADAARYNSDDNIHEILEYVKNLTTSPSPPMAALEAVSSRGEIKPFMEFVANAMKSCN